MNLQARDEHPPDYGDPDKLEDMDLQSLFYRAADMIEEALDYMNRTLIALCEGNQQLFNFHRDNTIITEKFSDRIHDLIVERMFSRETLVFSREDRMYLVETMDDVVDKAESCVRRASIYFPKNYPELTPRLVAISEKGKRIGSVLKDAVKMVFHDFHATLPYCKEVEDLRREARYDYLQFLSNLYKLKPEYTEMLYFDRLIRQVKIVINTANKFADGIRRLIFKYKL